MRLDIEKRVSKYKHLLRMEMQFVPIYQCVEFRFADYLCLYLLYYLFVNSLFHRDVHSLHSFL
jgi:hypothetical protein